MTRMQTGFVLGVLLLPLTVVSAQEQNPDQEKLKAAITAAQQFLVSQQKENGSWGLSGGTGWEAGMTSLTVKGLLDSGLTVEDKAVAAGLKHLRGLKPDAVRYTYEKSLLLIALEAANQPEQDRDLIAALAKNLAESQIQDGDMQGTWGYFGVKPAPTRGDHSNAQFAILGLRSAARSGVKVDPQVWTLAQTHWRSAQNEDGSWSYMTAQPKGTGSMTAAGVATLSICREMLKEPAVNLNECAEEETDEHIRRGLEWLGKNFSVRENPGHGSYLLYYMAGLSRAGRFTGQTKLGEHDWELEFQEFLILHQAKDGSFRGTAGETDQVLATSFALLVLSSGKN